MESLQQCLILLIMGLLMLMCEGVHHDRIFQRGNVPTTKLCIYVVDMAKSQEGGPIHSDEDETTLELQPACRLLAQKPDARYRNLLKNLRDTNRQENIAKCQKVASVIDVKANARGLQAWVEDIGGCDLNRCPWCDANVASKKAFDTLEAKFAAWTIEIFKSLKNESLPMKVADAQHSNVTDDALTLQVEGYVKDNALSLRNSLKAWKTALAKLPSGSMVSRNGDSKVSSIKAATGLIASGAISSGVGNYLQRPKNQCDHYRLKSAEDEGSGAVVLKSSVGNSTIEVIPARFTTAAPASAYDASVYDMCPTEHTDSCDNPIKPTMGLWPLGTAHRTPCGKKYDHLVNSYVSTLEHGRKLIRHGIADSDLKARQLITLVGDGRRLTSPRVSSLSLVGIGPVESVFSGETKMAKAMKNHMLEAADAAHLDLSFLNLVSNGYYEIAGTKGAEKAMNKEGLEKYCEWAKDLKSDLVCTNVKEAARDLMRAAKTTPNHLVGLFLGISHDLGKTPSIWRSHQIILHSAANYLLNVHSLMNCKSGCDRTGFAHAVGVAVEQMMKLYPDGSGRAALLEAFIDFPNLAKEIDEGSAEAGSGAAYLNSIKDDPANLKKLMIIQFRNIFMDNMMNIGTKVIVESTAMLGFKYDEHDSSHRNPIPPPFFPYDVDFGGELVVTKSWDNTKASFTAEFNPILVAVSKGRGA